MTTLQAAGRIINLVNQWASCWFVHRSVLGGTTTARICRIVSWVSLREAKNPTLTENGSGVSSRKLLPRSARTVGGVLPLSICGACRCKDVCSDK